ncbi:hypothetical protein AB0C77_09710 [Streptomyces sp. NPDC048629]|uniref:hypothetical protein n=1 Tax=Streptomyces sp. NPDC048629 TaxID=3154824 RepID=UPI003445BA39
MTSQNEDGILAPRRAPVLVRGRPVVWAEPTIQGQRPSTTTATMASGSQWRRAAAGVAYAHRATENLS